MGTHPINLVLRFALEMAAITSVGIWGWKQSDNWLQFVFAVGLPILLAAVWGTFAVPEDPSRSGSAPVVIPGFLRLIIELLIFVVATFALRDIELTNLSWMFAVVTVIHYAISYDRIQWLIQH